MVYIFLDTDLTDLDAQEVDANTLIALQDDINTPKAIE